MTSDLDPVAGVDLFQLVRAGDDAGLLARLAADRSVAAARDPDGISLVLFALYNGRAAVAQALADARLDLDIFEAAATGRESRLAELLGEDGPLARAWSPDGFTPLHLTAFFGQPGAARRLLDHGADAAAVARNPMSVQPLHSAVAGRHGELVALLIGVGADVNARQHGGWTPLQAAAANGDASTVDMLLSAGADPALANDAGRRPTDLAREHGHHELAERLAT